MPLTSQPITPQRAPPSLPFLTAGQQAYGLEATRCRLWRYEVWLLADCWRFRHASAQESLRQGHQVVGAPGTVSVAASTGHSGLLGLSSVLGCRADAGLFDQAEESVSDASACAGRLDDASPMALESEGRQGHAMDFAVQGSKARDEAPHAVWGRGGQACAARRHGTWWPASSNARTAPCLPRTSRHQHVTVDRVISWR
jgi:hypothetical protein